MLGKRSFILAARPVYLRWCLRSASAVAGCSVAEGPRRAVINPSSGLITSAADGQRPVPIRSDLQWPGELRQRPSGTFLPSMVKRVEVPTVDGATGSPPIR